VVDATKIVGFNFFLEQKGRTRKKSLFCRWSSQKMWSAHSQAQLCNSSFGTGGFKNDTGAFGTQQHKNHPDLHSC